MRLTYSYSVNRLSLLLSLILSSSLSLASTPASNNAESIFKQGQLLYAAEDYKSALPALQEAVELAPMESIYHHILGKCYGRIAETGSWLTALRYVRKTLREFKKAVQLDDNNIQAWNDLEEFYRRAPGFLGGNKDRAREISTRLAALKTADSEASPVMAAPEPP